MKKWRVLQIVIKYKLITWWFKNDQAIKWLQITKVNKNYSLILTAINCLTIKITNYSVINHRNDDKVIDYRPTLIKILSRTFERRDEWISLNNKPCHV